ncbi:MAG: rRNA maturation RNase YbeY [bacterium]
MVEINNKTKTKIPEKFLLNTVKKFLKYYQKENHEVSIAFVGDAAMRDLNLKYRKKIGPTDVLSFSGEGKFLGEIIIDCAQIKRQAKMARKNFLEELVFILIHGLLHLIGYSDKTEKGAREMEVLGEKFISRLSAFKI